MFCSNCGVPAEGNFCSACGAPLRKGVAAAPAPAPAPAPPADWSTTLDYQALLANPAVRTLIANAAAEAPESNLSETVLKVCEEAFKPVPGISTATAVTLAQAITTRLGIKTTKTRSAVLQRPPGTVLVALLCSLARQGHPVRRARQSPNSCIVEARMSRGLLTAETELIVAVHAEPPGTRVEAASLLKGQLFDYGKGNRALDILFADLAAPVGLG